ncbi:helix-turn-helix transcriptional regulator [Escherichia coli]|nr:helix-turn-helix transcriptional regulator [Escherichia coli]
MNTVSIHGEKNYTVPSVIHLESITTNKYLAVYTDNCDLTIRINNQEVFYPKESIIFIGRGVNFCCTIKKYDQKKKPYRVVRLNKEEILMLKDVFKSTHSYYIDEKMMESKINAKVIGVKSCQDYIKEFDSIERTSEIPLKLFKLACLISRMKEVKNIINSLVYSAATTFTDKVRNIIEGDVSRKWRLYMIADEFNISEVSVRKRLEVEGTSFNNLLIEIRMNKAMQLLLENEQQINKIAKDIGIFSPSYFIKGFKKHFGITPKQFILFFRG